MLFVGRASGRSRPGIAGIDARNRAGGVIETQTGGQRPVQRPIEPEVVQGSGCASAVIVYEKNLFGISAAFEPLVMTGNKRIRDERELQI